MYWRQASYGEYNGSTWERTADWQEFTGTVPNDEVTADGQRVTYSVRLLQPSASLPSVWQPKDVTVTASDATIQVDRDGSFGTRAALPENASYEGTSARPPQSPSRLRQAGREYPDRIVARYTQLPGDTPERVPDFTQELTADAENPYDAAVTIERWLESNKEYSLDVSHDPGEPVVDQFLFEMDRGYAQYFASAMVVMLRTKGIPARYVTGYKGGQPVGEEQFLVSAPDGHSWVEVYFPETGWVPFDPTPAAEPPTQHPQPPYNISLNRSAVAGAQVTIAVSKDGSPVVAAPVHVNEQRVGWTDDRGEVETRLPYVVNITITVRPPGSAGQFRNGSTNANSTTTSPRIGVPPPGEEPLQRYAIQRPGSLSVRSNHTGPDRSTKMFRSSTDVSVELDGTTVVGEHVVVQAWIEDVPMRDASVAIDGQVVGRTDTTGQANLSLSGFEPGVHELTVNRSGFTASLQFELRAPERESTPAETETPVGPINLSLQVPLDMPLPLGPISVAVSRAGAPVENARVSVGDRQVGMTDANGRLDARLPMQDTVFVQARGPAGRTDSQWLTGLVRNASVLLALVLWALILSFLGYRRFNSAARRRLHQAIAAVRSGLDRALALVIRAIERLIGFGHSMREAGLAMVYRLGRVPGLLRSMIPDRPDWPDPDDLLQRLLAWLTALIQRLLGATDLAGDEPGGQPVGEADEDAVPGASLKSLWSQFLSFVSVSDIATRTPGEIARHAIEQGLPEKPVEIIAETYRESEYGRNTVDSSRLDDVRSALGELKSHVEDSYLKLGERP